MADEKMCLDEKLCLVQNEIKAPKNMYNKFGGYYYRNAESIQSAAKPILKKYRCTLKVEDSIFPVMMNNEERVYVKAVATLSDWDSDKVITAVAYAREEEHRTKSTDAQVTGASSSYARKYALGGLFLLDDMQDDDGKDNTQHGREPEQEPKDQPQESPKPEEHEAQPKVNAKMIYQLQKLFGETGKKIDESLVLYKVTKLEDLTVNQGKHLYSFLLNWKKNHAQQA